MRSLLNKRSLLHVFKAICAFCIVLLVSACVANRSTSSEPIATAATSSIECGQTRVVGIASGVYAGSSLLHRHFQHPENKGIRK